MYIGLGGGLVFFWPMKRYGENMQSLLLVVTVSRTEAKYVNDFSNRESQYIKKKMSEVGYMLGEVCSSISHSS
jgi:hypothetical protein